VALRHLPRLWHFGILTRTRRILRHASICLSACSCVEGARKPVGIAPPCGLYWQDWEDPLRPAMAQQVGFSCNLSWQSRQNSMHASHAGSA
jgi:hypothetical protein